MPEPPQDAPEPRPADEGLSSFRKLLGSRRPTRLVAEAGAVAGAIVSIVALVQLVLPDGDDASATTTAGGPAPEVSLALPPDPVRPLTYGNWLVAVLGEDGEEAVEALDPAERDRPGVTVDYDLATEGYPPGTKLNVRFELSQQTPTGEQPLEPVWDLAEIDRDPDSCTCTSTFLTLPDPAAAYRVVVGVFPPDVTSGSPLKSAATEFGPAP